MSLTAWPRSCARTKLNFACTNRVSWTLLLPALWAAFVKCLCQDGSCSTGKCTENLLCLSHQNLSPAAARLHGLATGTAPEPLVMVYVMLVGMSMYNCRNPHCCCIVLKPLNPARYTVLSTCKLSCGNQYYL